MDKGMSKKIELIERLHGLHKEINRISNTYLQYDEINVSQRAILEALQEDAMTVPSIAKQYNVSRQHIQTNVNVLLQKGMVTNKTNSAHKRSKLIVITQKGKTLFNEVIDFEQRFMNDLFSQLSSKEIDITHKSLALMHEKATAILEAIK